MIISLGGSSSGLTLFSLFVLFQVGSSLKHSFTTSDDERSLIGPIGFPFGFLDSGHYDMTVYDFNLFVGSHHDEGGHSSAEEVMNGIDGVGFLLKKFDDESEFNHFMNSVELNASQCVFQSYLEESDSESKFDDDRYQIDGEGEVLKVTEDGVFLDMKKQSRWAPNKPRVSYDFHKGEAGYYFLIFQICPASKVSIHTHFELDFHFSNQDLFGNESYLSAGEMVLPHMFFYFFLCYALCLYLWVTNISLIQEGKAGHFGNSSEGQPIVYPIHNLMSLLLLLKTCSIFFESIRYHYLRVTGHADLWSVVYYTFAFMKGTILFTVILLIGSGWSFVKPFLSEREKKMILAILVLQVVNNIAIVVLTQETEGETSFDNWTAVLHLVDIICCCAVLIPIVWQVNTLEKNIEQSNGDHTDQNIDDSSDAIISELEFEDEYQEARPNNKRLSAKLKLFRSFYLLVVAYIYLTRIVVYLFATMLDYKHQWLRYFVVEAVTLAFYCTVGMQFKPMSENPYLSINNRHAGTARGALIELTT